MALRLGALGPIDWTRVDPQQFRRGIEVELEHGARDPETNVTNDDLTLTRNGFTRKMGGTNGAEAIARMLAEGFHETVDV